MLPHNFNRLFLANNKRLESMKTATTTTMPALATTVLAAVALIMGAARTVDAAVADTCKAAAASDVRVNVEQCISQLGSHRDSAEADTWGLAKVASLVGVNNADLAAADVKTLEAAGSPNVRVKPALAKCAALYKEVGMSFAGAYDQINNRAYPAGKQKLDAALAQAQQCNAAFGMAGVALPQPLAQRTVESIQIAIIAGAITNLIK